MYQLNTKAARKADTIGGAMITELGKYEGVFTQAEDIVAKSGTRGLAFEFKSNAGQKARLSIYTTKADGTELPGLDLVMALMTCLSLRGLKPVQGTVTKWDYDARAEFEVIAQVFPELVGKPIGLLLETEDWIKKDGSLSATPRPLIKSVYQAGTELTASEILDRKTTPALLQKLVAALRHRPVKNAPKPVQRHSYDAHTPAAYSSAEAEAEDFPF